MEQIMNNIHMNQLCKVCGEPAAGFHFGAFTCEGCKSFFGRTYNNVSGVSECKNGGRCEITKKNRTSCKSCRLRKCLSVGMSKSGSRYGRRSNWFKIHCLLSAQSQSGISSSPETNNNSSAVSNNNRSSPTNPHHIHSSSKSSPASTTTSDRESHRDRDRDRDRGHRSGHSPEQERSHSHHRTTSSAPHPPHFPHARSNHSSNGPPLPFPNLAALSPDSKESFLSSLNRRMMTPDLCDYFRSAAGRNERPLPFPLANGLNFGGKNGGVGGSFYPDDGDGAEELSRSRDRSPGSLESPNSEASAEESKSRTHTPLHAFPPGSPLDVKPSDVLSFDLLTRDLLKLGYDPLRLWPAMLTAQATANNPPSFAQFNPYRFMFPNFPAVAAGFPGGPGNVLMTPNGMTPSPLGVPIPNGHPLTSSSKQHGVPTPTSGSGSTLPENLNRRFPPFPTSVPSSLSLTPPISHHGDAAEPPSVCVKKFRDIPVQDTPIDLSAKGRSPKSLDLAVKVKREKIEVEDPDATGSDGGNSSRDFSDDEDEDGGKITAKTERKSEFGDDSDRENEGEEETGESEPFTLGARRRSSSASSAHAHASKRVRVRAATPLDLTRSSNSNSNPPKMATATAT